MGIYLNFCQTFAIIDDIRDDRLLLYLSGSKRNVHTLTQHVGKIRMKTTLDFVILKK